MVDQHIFFGHFQARNRVRNLIRILIVFVIIHSFLAPILASDYYFPLQFRSYTTEQGLTDNRVTFVSQDKNGFIWIATRNGISRFDGIEFKSFSHIASDSEETTVTDSSINTLLVDSKNNLWVGTAEGLSLLEFGQQTFRHFKPKTGGTSLSSGSITAIYEDHIGRIWIGGTNGIDVYNPDTKSIESVTIQASQSFTIDDINFIGESPNKELWVGTYSGIYQLSSRSQGFVSKIFKSNASDNVVNMGVSALEWLDNESAVISAGTSLYLLNRVTQTVKPLIVHTGQELIEDIVVFSLKKDSNGVVWIGTSNKGLLFLEPNLKTVHQQMPDPLNTHSLASDSVIQVMRDRSDLMWVVPSWGGIQVWLPITEKFRHLKHHLLDENSIPAPRVWSLEKGNGEDLWIGTESGIAHWQPQTNTYTRYVHDTEDNKTVLPGAVYTIFRQNSRRVWMGTAFGLSLINTISNKAMRFVNDEYDPHSIGYGSIIGINELDSHHLLLATEFDGLHMFNTNSFKSKKLEILKGEEVSQQFSQVTGIQSSTYGGQWIMTEAGLIYYEPKSKTKVFIGKASKDASGLNNRRVSSVYEASDGGVWFGTLGNGLNYSDNVFSKRRTFQYFEEVEELRNASVMSILPEGSDILWLGTTKGLLKFNIKTQKVNRFNRYFGLQHDEFSPNAVEIGRGGELYFGGVNGVTFFKPKEIFSSQTKPGIYITDIKTNYTSLFGKNTLLAPSSIELHPDDIVLSIHFSLLDFAIPENTQYMFRLVGKGFKDDWINYGSSREVTYTNLDDGEYLFQVKGLNHEGIQSDTISEINIKMIPPWWDRWWAYLLYIAVVGIISGVFIEERFKKSQAERREASAIREREETLKQVLWGSGDEMWDWNIKNNMIARNHALHAFNLNKDTISADEWIMTINEREREEIKSQLQEHIVGNIPFFEAIYRVVGDEGKTFWILSRAKAVERNRDGRALRVVGTHKDISNIKSTEDKLRLIAKAFENTSDGVSVTDTRFINVAVNNAFCEITGYIADEVVGKPFFFSGLNTDEVQSMMEAMTALNTRGSWHGELIEKRKSGELFYIDLNIDAVKDSDGHITHYVSVFSDITFKKKAEEDLIRLANYDSLTKLPNRTLLKDRLEQTIILARHQKRKFAILFLDVDDFKTVNDSLGHPAGDRMLKEVARRLLLCVQETDTVSRLGGDEFIILLESMSSQQDILDCCTRILEGFKESVELGNEHATVSTSIGIGFFPEDGEDVDTLIKHADIAMYHAKRAGKNNYQFFTEEMNRLAVERLSIENNIRKSIETNQFKLFYQPKVDTQTLKLAGFEALVRWHSPDGRYTLPTNFITVAEESGLIIDLGEWIINEACQQIKQWESINSDIKIAVNLSGRQFQDKSLVEKVSHAISQYGVNPQSLELEITESILMTNTEYTMNILGQFREMGITLSLDDFGTGYSSLRYLKVFPVHKLKIDQSFVRDLPQNEEDANIVSLIIGLSHKFNLRVVVEGVESKEQLDFVREAGGDEVQGYLFSQPVDKENATVLVEKGGFEF